MEGFGSARRSWQAFPSPEEGLRTPSPCAAPKEVRFSTAATRFGWQHTASPAAADCDCTPTVVVKHYCNKARRTRPRSSQLVLSKPPGAGCTCRRSRCRKRYCECFSSGKPCGDDCRCLNCFNALPVDGSLAALLQRLPLKPEVAAYLRRRFKL